MKIIETDYTRFRTLAAHQGQTEATFFTTVAKEGIAYWSTQKLMDETQTVDDMMFKCKPQKTYKTEQMILCCTVSEVQEPPVVVKVKKVKKVIKKKGKLTKDERKILARQKKQQKQASKTVAAKK